MFMSYDMMITSDNPVRLIDLVCKKFFVEQNINEKCKGQSNIGCKSFSPDSMLKLIVYGYFNGITSSRKLEAETYRNVEMIWLMEGYQPDHWTICEFRRDSGIAIKDFLAYFRKFLIDHKYATTERVVFDGTKVKAYARKEMLTIESITAKLENINKSLSEYLSKLESEDNKDEELEKANSEIKKLKDKIRKLEQSKVKLEQSIEEIKKSGKKYYAPNDDEATMVKGREGKFPGYNVQIGVETKGHFILSDNVTDESCDIQQLKDNIKSINDNTGVIPKEVLADKGYSNITQILEIENNGTTQCYIPLVETKREKQEKEGITFTYNKENDTYICCQGKKLLLFSRNQKGRDVYYNIYKCHQCKGCAIRTSCTKSKSGRIIKRIVNQDKIDIYKEKIKSDYARERIKERKTVVEHPFGTIKMLMGKFNLLLKGKVKAQIEFDYYTAAYNLKRLIGCTAISDLIKIMEKYRLERA